MNHQLSLAHVAQRLMTSLEAMTRYARIAGDPSLPSLQSMFQQAELTLAIAKLHLSPCALDKAIEALEKVQAQLVNEQTPAGVSSSVILALHAAREAKTGSL